MVEPTRRQRDQRRALIEITPGTMARLRDPRIVLALALVVAGAIAEVVGYIGVSGTIDPGEQLPYIISGGIGGVFLLGMAAALLFSSDIREVKERLEQSTVLVQQMAEEVRELRTLLAADDEHADDKLK